MSHTFIRREVRALENQGVRVFRYSLRAPHDLVDEADRSEAARTRVMLQPGQVAILVAVVRTLMTRPLAFARAIKLAWHAGRGSDRGVVVHMAYLAEACLLLGWMARDRATHLHAHFGTNPAAVAMYCRQLGGPPYSFTVHGPEEFDRATLLALDEKIARAAFVVAISEFGRGQLLRWCDPRHWPRIHVVRCGLDDEMFDRPTPPITRDPRLVCIGRLCEQKGQLLLVQAAAQLRAEGLDFEIVLVGDGPMRPQIEQAIAGHGLERIVTITGWADHSAVVRHLVAARALVLPSLAEGLPVVIMEAMALGRPIISTAVAGIPELLRDGVNGWLVPPGSVEALVDAMRQAIRASPDALASLGSGGREAVESAHRVRVEAAKLRALFAGDLTRMSNVQTVSSTV